ncbi:hypothetical protein [Amycolatopsis sp. lyj-108]|uniref:hypothetical protein n=1 Tax=Amycolatopsis sp. lyj-108 TaxID=2789286 RepID=UPI00397A4499
MSRQIRQDQRPNPHGWIGYVVEDTKRTDNAIRLGRWIALIVLMVLAFGGMALALVAHVSPVAACGLLSATVAGSGYAVRRRRR